MRKAIRKQRQEAAPALLQTQVQRDLAQAAGTEFFQYRDPLYHVTENFQQTFDRIGMSHAAGLAGEQEEARSQPGALPRTETEDRTGAEGVSADREPLARKGAGEPRLRNLPNTMIPLQGY